MAPRKSMLGKGNRPRHLPPPLTTIPPPSTRRGLGTGTRPRKSVQRLFDTQRKQLEWEPIMNSTRKDDQLLHPRSKEKGIVRGKCKLQAQASRKENLVPTFQSSPIENVPNKKVARSLFAKNTSTPCSSAAKIPEPPALLTSCVSKRFTCFKTRNTPHISNSADSDNKIHPICKTDGISRTQLFKETAGSTVRTSNSPVLISASNSGTTKKIACQNKHLGNEEIRTLNSNSSHKTKTNTHEAGTALHNLNHNCTATKPLCLSNNKTGAGLDSSPFAKSQGPSRLPLLKSRLSSRMSKNKIELINNKSHENLEAVTNTRKEPEESNIPHKLDEICSVSSNTRSKRKLSMEIEEDTQAKRICFTELYPKAQEQKFDSIKLEPICCTKTFAAEIIGLKDQDTDRIDKQVGNLDCYRNNLDEVLPLNVSITTLDCHVTESKFSTKATQTDFNSEDEMKCSVAAQTDFPVTNVDCTPSDYSHIKTAVNNLLLLFRQQNDAIFKEINNIVTFINSKENGNTDDFDKPVNSARNSLRRSLRIAERLNSNNVSNGRNSMSGKLEEHNYSNEFDYFDENDHLSCSSSGKSLNKSLHMYRKLQSDFQFLKTPQTERKPRKSCVRTPKPTPRKMLSQRVHDQLQLLYD